MDIARALRHFFLQTRLGRTLVFLSLPAALLAVAFWPEHHEPPIFDVQMHYNAEAWDRFSVTGVLGTMRKINVRGALVSSTPNEGTFKLRESGGESIIPMLAPYRSRADRETWFNDPEILRFVEQELARGLYRGIGEFHLLDGQVDTPVVRRLLELAIERDLLLSAHSDVNALRQMFGVEPRLRILWAHAGMMATPGAIGEMLGKYPKLRVELSHRTDVAPNGQLAPEWRELMLQFPDRFMLGSGTYTNEHWYQFRYVMGNYRAWLAQLPPQVATRIAHANAEALFTRR